MSAGGLLPRIRKGIGAALGFAVRRKRAVPRQRSAQPVLDLSPHEVSQRFQAAKDRVLAVARAGSGGRLQIVAESGYGKTRLLEQVHGELQGMGYMSLFATAPHADSIGVVQRSDDPDALLRAKTDLAAVITGLADDLFEYPDLMPDTSLAEFHARLVRASSATHRPNGVKVEINATIDVKDSHDVAITDSANPTVSVQVDEVTRQKLDLAAMTDGFVSALTDLASQVPLAILVDDLYWLIGGIAADWLEAAFKQLHRVLILTATWSSSVGDDEAPYGEIVRLGTFSQAETMDYACQMLCPQGWSVEAAAEVGKRLHATTALPGDLASACLTIRESIEPCDDPGVVGERLKAVFDRDGAMFGYKGARASVDRAASRHANRPIQVFDQLAVLRRFTRAVVSGVLEHTPDRAFAESPGFGAFYDWLSQADGYITNVDDGRIHERIESSDAEHEAEADTADDWWDQSVGVGTISIQEQRLHDLIRTAATRDYAQNPAQLHALHESAEAYYRSKVNFDAPIERKTESGKRTRSLYASYSRYEEPQWRQESREWIFHASRLPPERFAETRDAMIRLFFEAFWWWDAEVPSSYCDRLIADLRTLPDSLKGRWVDLLDEFRRGYVAGTANQILGRDTARWRQAEDSLSLLWQMLELRKGDPPPEEERNLRSIYIITSCLRADTAWYASRGRETDRRRAAGWLELARAACSHEADHWIGSWALYLEAALWAPVDEQRALGLLAGLPERIEEDEDRELLALTTLLHADIAWRGGRRQLAFDIYTRAALHFFVYHVRQEVNGQAPNPYTVSRYEAVRSAVRARLEEARADGDEELARTAQIRIREYFAPYWERVDAEPEEATGLPPQPGFDDLGKATSKYAKDARSLIDAMAAELDEEIDQPLTELPTPWPSDGTDAAA